MATVFQFPTRPDYVPPPAIDPGAAEHELIMRARHDVTRLGLDDLRELRGWLDAKLTAYGHGKQENPT